MRPGGIASRTADAQHLSMWNRSTSCRRAAVHRDRAHVPVIGVVPVRMMQADVDAKVDLVVLRIPPACINDLVGVGCRIHGTIGDAEIDAVMSIVIHPIAEAVGPVAAGAGVTYTLLGRRRSGRCRRRAIFVGHDTGVNDDAIIKCVVGGGMIEDRFLRGGTRKWGVKKWCHRLQWRISRPGRGATHGKEKTAKKDCCKKLPARSCHNLP